MNTRTSSVGSMPAAILRHLPWWRWLLTAAAFPPAGYLAHAIAGRVDTAPSAALAGAIAGAGIGAGQWALLRNRGVAPEWIPATAAGLAAGLASGAALVSYRTDRPSLAVMGAVSGLGIGLAQAAVTRMGTRTVLWAGATAAGWALGWTITALGGIDVDEQWSNFGAYGAITFALLQSTFVGRFVPEGRS